MGFKNLLKMIRCEHEYKLIDSFLIEFGMSKMLIYKCNKCGREKARVI